jgi:hypothetical protein
MGKSPSIQDLESRDDKFRAYLQELETELQQKSSTVDSRLQTMINDFYTNGNYTDAKDLVSGQNYDFIHDQKFSFAIMKTMVEAISAVVFAGGATPPGSEVDSAGQQAVAAKLGPEVGNLANLELYMAGQVFDVLCSVILNFGTSTALPFDTNLQSKSLGFGVQLFTAVSAESYRSPSFFNNDYIYEYLYIYDVKFSVQQANAEPNQILVHLYEDQIAVFTQREHGLMTQLANRTLTPQAYASAHEAYDALIAAFMAKVRALKSEASTTR